MPDFGGEPKGHSFESNATTVPINVCRLKRLPKNSEFDGQVGLLCYYGRTSSISQVVLGIKAHMIDILPELYSVLYSDCQILSVKY
jgi:hypothetical protein